MKAPKMARMLLLDLGFCITLKPDPENDDTREWLEPSRDMLHTFIKNSIEPERSAMLVHAIGNNRRVVYDVPECSRDRVVGALVRGLVERGYQIIVENDSEEPTT